MVMFSLVGAFADAMFIVLFGFCLGPFGVQR